MIDVRRLFREEGRFPFNLLVRSDAYCQFAGVPSFYFDSISEYWENQDLIPEGEIFRLPEATFIGSDEMGAGEILDGTGRIKSKIVRTWVDEPLAIMVNLPSPRGQLREIAKGMRIYDINAKRRGDGIDIQSFDIVREVPRECRGLDYFRGRLQNLKI